jgi:glycosyltransferase involved in cell wall biosynthesis
MSFFYLSSHLANFLSNSFFFFFFFLPKKNITVEFENLIFQSMMKRALLTLTLIGVLCAIVYRLHLNELALNDRVASALGTDSIESIRRRKDTQWRQTFERASGGSDAQICMSWYAPDALTSSSDGAVLRSVIESLALLADIDKSARVRFELLSDNSEDSHRLWSDDSTFLSDAAKRFMSEQRALNGGSEMLWRDADQCVLVLQMAAYKDDSELDESGVPTVSSRFRRARLAKAFGHRRAVALVRVDTDRVPAHWVRALNDDVEQVWLLSEWNRRVAIASGVDAERIRVMDVGVRADDAADDDEPPNRDGSDRWLPPSSPLDADRCQFVVLGVANPLSGTRKGVAYLIAAFLAAFGRTDDAACLLLKTTEHEPLKSTLRRENVRLELVVDEFVATVLGWPAELWEGRVGIVTDELSAADMRRLYANVELVALPSHAEALGMSLMEAMAVGTPVLATNATGHLDFMPDEAAFLLRVADGASGRSVVEEPAASRFLNTPFAFSSGGYRKHGHEWTHIDIIELVELLKFVRSHGTVARARGNSARRYIANNRPLRRTALWLRDNNAAAIRL